MESTSFRHVDISDVLLSLNGHFGVFGDLGHLNGDSRACRLKVPTIKSLQLFTQKTSCALPFSLFVAVLPFSCSLRDEKCPCCRPLLPAAEHDAGLREDNCCPPPPHLSNNSTLIRVFEDI